MDSDVAPDSATAYRMRSIAFDTLLRQGARDLSVDELEACLGPRFPPGDPANKVRGARIRTLNALGFTRGGRRID